MIYFIDELMLYHHSMKNWNKNERIGNVKADMNSDILPQTAAIFFILNLDLKQVIG